MRFIAGLVWIFHILEIKEKSCLHRDGRYCTGLRDTQRGITWDNRSTILTKIHGTVSKNISPNVPNTMLTVFIGRKNCSACRLGLAEGDRELQIIAPWEGEGDAQMLQKKGTNRRFRVALYLIMKASFHSYAKKNKFKITATWIWPITLTWLLVY